MISTIPYFNFLFIFNFFLDMFWFVDENEIIAVQLQTIYNVFKQGPLAKAEKAQ